MSVLRVLGVVKDALTNASSLRASFGCRTRKRPCREAERTNAYVSIHDKGADKVVRQMTPSAGVEAKNKHGTIILRPHAQGLGEETVGESLGVGGGG